MAAESSRAPADLSGDLRFDVRDEAFWRLGMDQARAFLGALEALAD